MQNTSYFLNFFHEDYKQISSKKGNGIIYFQEYILLKMYI